jgi:hypothetical protein
LSELIAIRFFIVRLAKPALLPEIMRAPLPVRYIIIILGPPIYNVDYHELGRAMGTLMSDKVTLFLSKITHLTLFNRLDLLQRRRSSTKHGGFNCGNWQFFGWRTIDAVSTKNRGCGRAIWGENRHRCATKTENIEYGTSCNERYASNLSYKVRNEHLVAVPETMEEKDPMKMLAIDRRGPISRTGRLFGGWQFVDIPL